jgi:hypothetical protein
MTAPPCAGGRHGLQHPGAVHVTPATEQGAGILRLQDVAVAIRVLTGWMAVIELRAVYRDCAMSIRVTAPEPAIFETRERCDRYPCHAASNYPVRRRRRPSTCRWKMAEDAAYLAVLDAR